MKTTVSLKYLLIGSLLALAAVGCAAGQVAPPTEPGHPTSEEVPTVSRNVVVVGVGKITLAPELAKVSVGAQASADTVSEAKADVDQRTASIIETLTELGIAEDDVQTSNYSFHFEPKPVAQAVAEEKQEQQPGYLVSSTLDVTIRNIEIVDEVLDRVVEAGANHMYGFKFYVDDDTEWRSKAWAEAVADARAQAQELAQLSGAQLGEVVQVSQIIGDGGMPVPVAGVGMGGGSSVASGELELSVQVQMTFALQ